MRPAHPGLPTAPRRIGVRAAAVRHVDAVIAPGEELFAFADRLARGFGGGAALLRFSALPLWPVAIHVPEPDPTRRQIMRYAAATLFDERCELVSAQMSVGRDGDTPVLHCHGHIVTAGGRAFGGHLSRDGCRVAVDARPATVRCTVFDGVHLAPTWDAETGFSLLSPTATSQEAELPPRRSARGEPDRSSVRAEPLFASDRSEPASLSVRAELVEALGAATGPSTSPGRTERQGSSRTSSADRPPGHSCGWMLRFKPDEDLVDATRAFAAAHGLARPRIIGGVGSLMRATLAADDGTVTEIDGPGLEIVTVEGELDALRMVVADLAGRVHAGRAVAGGNPICVTIELFVEATP